MPQSAAHVEPSQPAPAPLEMVEYAPAAPQERIEVFRELPPEPPRRTGLKVMLGVLAVVGLAGYFFWPANFKWAHALAPAPSAPQLLMVNSEPSGARVFIGRELVGETPWAGDNRWRGFDQVPVRLELKGHRTWEGTINGNEPSSLDVKLKKR